MIVFVTAALCIAAPIFDINNSISVLIDYRGFKAVLLD